MAFSLASSKVPLWLTHILRPLGVWTFKSHSPETGRSSKIMFITLFPSFNFFKTSRCHFTATLRLAMPLRIYSFLSTDFPLQFSAILCDSLRFSALLFRCCTLQYIAVAAQFKSGQILSSRFRCNSPLCFAIPLRICAPQSFASPLQFRATPRLSFATRRFAMLFRAQLFHCASRLSNSIAPLCFAMHFPARPRRCYSLRFVSVAYSTSSQVKRPFPELRH